MINCLYFQLREKIVVLEYDDGIYRHILCNVMHLSDWPPSEQLWWIADADKSPDKRAAAGGRVKI